MADIARTYDVLGWFAPVIIKVKILSLGIQSDWNEEVPESIVEVRVVSLTLTSR